MVSVLLQLQTNLGFLIVCDGVSLFQLERNVAAGLLAKP